MGHRHAPLTPTGTLRMCQRNETASPSGHIADHFNVSRPTDE